MPGAYCKLFGSKYDTNLISSKNIRKLKLIHSDLESKNTIIKPLNILSTKKFDRIFVCAGVIKKRILKILHLVKLRKFFKLMQLEYLLKL